jgi:hypothetical protein
MASGREELPEREGISFSPDNFESGLVDDIDATITSVDCVTWSYNGKAQPAPAGKIGFKPDDAEAFEQHYSAGSLDRIYPADDGSTFFRKGSSKGSAGLGSGSNFAMFIISLVEQGYPKDKLDNIRNLVGLYGHFARVPQPERAGLAAQKKEGDRPKTILICKTIHKLPWEKEGNVKLAQAQGKQVAAPTPISKPNGSPAAQNQYPADLFTTAVAYAMSVLEKNGPMPIDKLGMACYTLAGNGAKYRREVINYVKTADFLENPDLPFTVDTQTGMIGL